MPWWQWLIDAAGVLVLAAVAYCLALVLRRRLLARDGGTFELSHRVRPDQDGRGWVLGLGRYSGESLEWFRLFSLAPRPKRTWVRESMAFDGRRHPFGSEQASLYPDHLVITCQVGEAEVELAMSPASLTGFSSWLESRPPGTDWSR